MDNEIENNGKAANGKFTKGNKFGKGQKKGNNIRSVSMLIKALVTDEDVVAIVKVLVDKAKGGDLKAIAELFDRLIGKAKQGIELESAGEKLGVRLVFDIKEIKEPKEPKIITRNNEKTIEDIIISATDDDIDDYLPPEMDIR